MKEAASVHLMYKTHTVNSKYQNVSHTCTDLQPRDLRPSPQHVYAPGDDPGVGTSRAASTDRLLPQKSHEHGHKALDYAITQNLFDEKGNIAPRGSVHNYHNAHTMPSREKQPKFDISNQQTSHHYRHRKPPQPAYEQTTWNNRLAGGTYYTSTLRVEPMYMSSPYQPNSIDRAEI